MALQKDRRRVNVKGGGILQVREIDPGTGTFADLGFISDDVFTDEHTMVESIDSKGDYIDTKSGARKVQWTSTLMQTSKEEIDLMRNAEGKYYELYYKVVLNNANIQEFVIPIARITPGAVLEFKSATQRTIKLTITALAPAAALTRTPTDYNTTIWTPYVLVENAVAVGVPTDAVTVPRAAI